MPAKIKLQIEFACINDDYSHILTRLRVKEVRAKSEFLKLLISRKTCDELLFSCSGSLNLDYRALCRVVSEQEETRNLYSTVPLCRVESVLNSSQVLGYRLRNIRTMPTGWNSGIPLSLSCKSFVRTFQIGFGRTT